ncbi:unnamed protein product [Heterobilharzia americana]|nr:unnamed protein product [Heterobilharzia americana]
MVKDSANGHAPINSSYYCHVTKIEKNKKPQVFSVFGEIKLPKIVTGEYKWDRPTQGLILGAFFWGHIFTHIPGGLLSVKFGPKWVAFCSILSCGLVELCIPISSHLSYITVIILRMIEGLLLGALSPAIGCLLGNWAPPGEKSRFGSLIGCGTQLGTVIGQILAGVISYPRLVDLNTEPQTFMYISYWPYVHYLFGVLNVLFALLWSVIVYDRPQKHPWISNNEKQYLIENIYNDVNAINTVNQAEKPNITDKAEKSIENGKM